MLDLRLHHISDHIHVRQLHTLWKAGGAGGVRDESNLLIWVDRHSRRLAHRRQQLLEALERRTAGCSSALVVRAESVHAFDRCALGNGRIRLVEERPGAEELRGTSIEELVVDLVRSVQWVERCHTRADELCTEECNRIVDRIGREETDNVAVPEAAGSETCGDRLDHGFNVGVADGAASGTVHQRRRVTKLSSAAEEQLRERHRLQRREWRLGLHHSELASVDAACDAPHGGREGRAQHG